LNCVISQNRYSPFFSAYEKSLTCGDEARRIEYNKVLKDPGETFIAVEKTG
jgi:hypothetical protein